MYEVTLTVGTQAVAGFDNLTRWSQVRGTVIGLEGHYDLLGYDTRCTVRYSDKTRTAIGWATDGATMERPYLVEGFLENGDDYITLLFDLEQAEAVADSLSWGTVYDLTLESYDLHSVYSGGYDRDRTRITIDPDFHVVYHL